jgi:type I restriction enzyme S subunit
MVKGREAVVLDGGVRMQVSILNKSELENVFTIGAEFYLPYYVEKVEKIKSKKKVYLLGDLCKLITDGDHSTTQYTDEGVLYLLSESIKEGHIDTSIRRYISKQLHNSLKRSKLRPRNIVITKTGVYFGKSAVIPDDFQEANTSAHVGKLEVNEKLINPYYLSTFFNCEYGYSQLRRRGIKASRPEIKLIEFFDIKVFVAEESFQEAIEKIIKKSVEILDNSKNEFTQAQNLLLGELDLINWRPNHRLAFVKNYSVTEQAKRIDAEYYQPKYEEIEQAIKQYSGGHSTIGREFKQNKSTFKVDGKKSYQYVEIGSVNVSNGEISANEVIGEELPANAKRSLKKNDVIVSKVRTYRGGITIVEENGYVGSGAFTVLRENGRINKETLLAFLHSKPLLAWSLKPNTGTSYPVIIDDDILNLPIPLIIDSKQTEIQQKITESFSLRKKSKHLLECAKRAVEVAIEQDEQTAIEWLEAQIED